MDERRERDVLFGSEECWKDSRHVFALEGDPAAHYITARPLHPELTSNHITSLMRDWVQNCHKKHTRCRELIELARAQGSPNRLLDVGLPKTPNIRLHVNYNQEPVAYAALTYCWGGDQKTKTTKANYQERLDMIMLGSLPKTIQDAVNTSRRLGFRYLWVDAFCIIQDDENDWEREVAKMSRIYEGASITISASKASCSNSGFLQERNVSQAYDAVYKIPWQRIFEGVEEVGWIMLAEEPIHNKVEEQLETRGWALQERLRSPCLLRFGSKQLEWICHQEHRVDGGCAHKENKWYPEYFKGTLKDQLKLGLSQGNFDDDKLEILHNDWTDLVGEYSKRHLSKLSDKLPAFAAIAESFAYVMRYKSHDYWAGLWKADISMQLLWRRSTAESLDDDTQVAERSCPSWSWSSIQEGVEFSYPRLKWGDDTLECLGCNIMLKSVDLKYGEVKSVRLTVKGYVRQAYWTGCSFVNIDLEGNGDLKTTLPIKDFWDMHRAIPPQHVWCLEINLKISESITSYGLILTLHDDNIFTRVGYFEFNHPTSRKYSRNLNWFYKDERQIIHII